MNRWTIPLINIVECTFVFLLSTAQHRCPRPTKAHESRQLSAGRTRYGAISPRVGSSRNPCRSCHSTVVCRTSPSISKVVLVAVEPGLRVAFRATRGEAVMMNRRVPAVSAGTCESWCERHSRFSTTYTASPRTWCGWWGCASSDPASLPYIGRSKDTCTTGCWRWSPCGPGRLDMTVSPFDIPTTRTLDRYELPRPCHRLDVCC